MIDIKDLEEVEFSVSFRGYNSNQVDEYIDKVVNEFKNVLVLLNEKNDLINQQNAKIISLNEKLSLLENSENTSDTVQDTSNNVIESETNKTNDMIEDAFDKYNSYVKKAKQLKKIITDFKAQAFNLYNVQINQLQDLKFDFDTDVNSNEDKPQTNDSPIIESKTINSDELAIKKEVKSQNNNHSSELNALIDDLSELMGIKRPNNEEYVINEAAKKFNSNPNMEKFDTMFVSENNGG